MTDPEAVPERREIVERLRKLVTWLLTSRLPGHELEAVEAAETLKQAIAALQQESPRAEVKPLEWRDHRGHTFPDTWTALSPLGGVFEIEERSASDSPAYVASGPGYAFIADKDSLDEAKAAAQADYEARILSALAHPLHQPAPEAAEAIAGQQRLIRFFNEPAAFARWGNQGDVDGLSPADTAERALREVLAAPAPEPQAPTAIRPSDPLMILGGIRQFGLAADGSDLRDLEAAIAALTAANERSR